MKIIKEIKKDIDKNNDIDNTLSAMEKICILNIKGIIEDGFRFETYMTGTQLHIGLCREYSTKKTGDEYIQLFIDACYETNDSNAKFSQQYDLFGDDEDFNVETFINHIKNSEEYKYIKNHNLKAISCNCGVNET